jgi:hypothetical protein
MIPADAKRRQMSRSLLLIRFSAMGFAVDAVAVV